ncbi:MAG: tetratricopeptide repeat protein [Planktothrix sp. GU0601_MAG3]|nr:MAG: tetratricopeptide repeat protein [Planktothrix sp. GU0601_MAG3]
MNNKLIDVLLQIIKTLTPGEYLILKKKMQELDKNNIKEIHNQGLKKAQKGEYKGAIENFNLVLMIKPDSATTYISRGVCYLKLGNLEKAIQDCDKAIEIDPKNPTAYYNKGNNLRKLQKNLLALSSYNQAINYDKSNTEAYYNRGLTHRDLGNIQEAIADLEKAASLFEDTGNIAYYLKALEAVESLKNLS